jgi:methyl-accepting chemotaxis protein
MSKLTTKIAFPIILTGIFAILVFVSLGYGQYLGDFYSEPGFYLIIIFLIIYVFFFGLSTGQNLSSPIKKILDMAVGLSDGDLSSRVYLETKDDLSELAKIFNKIAGELEESRLQQQNTEKSVGIKVQAKTKDLEETINALEQKVKNRTMELEKLIEESDALQESVKNKGMETAQLKKELSDFEEKISKYRLVKKAPQKIPLKKTADIDKSDI